MTKISNVLQRKTSDGKTFLVFELVGELEILISESTAKPYATVRKTTIPCALDEPTARAMIGSNLPGRIEKVKCEPYTYQPSNSIEVITLNYTYAYVDESLKTESRNEPAKFSLEQVEVD